MHNNKDSIYEGFSPIILKSSNILYPGYVNCIAHKYDTKKTSTRKDRFMFTSRKLVKVIAIAYYYSHWSKKVPHSEERAEIKMLFSFYSMLINFFFCMKCVRSHNFGLTLFVTSKWKIINYLTGDFR